MKNLKELIHNVFGKDHLVRTFWTIVCGVILFIGGQCYNASKGPTKVIITNPNSIRDTVVLRITGQEGNSAKIPEVKIDRLLSDVGWLKNYFIMSEQGKASLPGKNVPVMIDSSKLGMSVNEFTTKIPHFTKLVFARKITPHYQLPSIVKGYTGEQLSSFARFFILTKNVRKNRSLIFTATILDSTWLTQVSPLMVDILRQDSPNNYTLIFNQQYILQPNDNIINIPVNFDVGVYKLQVGVYKIDELNQEYPPFYRTSVEINVTD